MGTQSDAILMTQAQYAEHRGVSRQRISNLAGRGMQAAHGRLVVHPACGSEVSREVLHGLRPKSCRCRAYCACVIKTAFDWMPMFVLGSQCLLVALASCRQGGGPPNRSGLPPCRRAALPRRATPVYAGLVSTLETIVEDLKSLPPGKLEVAADFIQRLKRISQEERQAILVRTAASLSRETVDEMEKAIEEGCEKIDEDGW